MRQNRMIKNGFTLIELLVALVILGILVAAGVPGMQTLWANMSVSSSSDQMVNSLAYARGEAVSRVSNVSIRSVSGTADWSAGWTVFVDDNGGCTVDGTDQVIRVVDMTSSNVTVTATTNATACIAFNSLGENAASIVRGFNIAASSATPKNITVTTIGYASIN